MTETQSWRPSGTDYPNAPIQVLLALIVKDLPPIGKTQRNEQQGFNFRGIDDVMIELNPLLGKYGVVILPDVLERIGEERMTRNNTVMHTVHLHVRFRFVAPDGTELACSTWGEGTDAGDKATNKAMTSVLKYALFQVFAIADASSDSDHHTPEPSVPVADDERHAHLGETITAAKADGTLTDDDVAGLGSAYGKRNWPLTVETMEEAEKAVADLLAAKTPDPKADISPADLTGAGAQPERDGDGKGFDNWSKEDVLSYVDGNDGPKVATKRDGIKWLRDNSIAEYDEAPW